MTRTARHHRNPLVLLAALALATTLSATAVTVTNAPTTHTGTTQALKPIR